MPGEAARASKEEKKTKTKKKSEEIIIIIQTAHPRGAALSGRR